VVPKLILLKDDYITKPFRAEELLDRVRAVLRRTAPAAAMRYGSICGSW
jgi:DNA-binding response OmpR family regulator